MKRIFLVLGLVASLSFINVAFAAKHWHTSKIKYVYALHNGAILIAFDKKHPECKNASGTVLSWQYVYVGQNNMTKEGIKNIYSMALTAYSTEKTVSVYFDDATTGCYIDRMFIRHDV